MIIALVYFKDRSSRMQIYVWDELYFFKGSYSIRITQSQGCGIAMPDSPNSYIEPAGQVDFPG